RPRTLREWCARGNSSRNLLPPDQTFHFSFVLLQEVVKRLRAFAGIASHDSMHDTPPIADILHVAAQNAIEKEPRCARRGEVWKLPRGHVQQEACAPHRV